MSFTDYTGMDMLKIDIANTYGLDKELFEDRIKWVDENFFSDHSPHGFASRRPKEEYIKEASEPLLFEKALNAYDKAISKKPIGHNMFMDATASGLQIMSALSRCKTTGMNCNLINNGLRNDPYTIVTDEMVRRLPDTPLFDGLTAEEIRKLVKKPIMTHYYNSLLQPTAVFGDKTVELETFYKILKENFPGAEDVLACINACWDENAKEHSWTLPDGHVAKVKVLSTVDTKIETEELSVRKLSYRFHVNQPSKVFTSLAPNVIHSIDAYVVREMIRRADFEIAHIHDAFTCHPNNMVKAMKNYREILAEIAESNLLTDILSEITGKDIRVYAEGNMADEVRQAEYALS